jgi:DNA-directed RNA polymerase subunit delta
MSKKRLVKDYDKLEKDIVTAVKMEYPNGFAHRLITYTGAKGEKVSALPFETDDVYYLIRMTVSEARQIIRDDEDYDDDGKLRGDFNVEGLDDITEAIVDDEVDDDLATTSEDEDDDEEYSKPSKKRYSDEDEGDDDY